MPNTPEKTVFIPLDSRPVCTRLPESLGRLCGWRMVLPPARLMGGLHTPADRPAIRAWLQKTALPNAAALYVSADLLAYGGLVFSREMKTKPADALKNLNFIRKVKSHYPDLRIYAFGVILRDSITVRTQADFELWEKLSTGRAPYPEWFLDIRKRNHNLNKALIEMTADGTLDFALLGKEDTAPNNPFSAEVDELTKHAKIKKSDARCAIINGTDELPQLLIARNQCLNEGYHPKFLIDPIGEKFLYTKPIFESVQLKKTLEQQIKLVSGQIVRDKGYSVRLMLHTPPDEQKDLFALQLKTLETSPSGDFVQPALRSEKYYDQFVSAIERERKLVAVADLAWANGADQYLVEGLLSHGRFFNLASYAGWNTASNTLGTTIALAAITATLKKMDTVEKAQTDVHLSIMLERLMDDCLYQSLVRPQVAAASPQPHDFEFPMLAQDVLHRGISNQLYTFVQPHVNGRAIETCLMDNACLVINKIGHKSARLPWNRLFEAEIVPDVEYNIVQIEE